jgi:hypothetical protein
MSLNSRVTVGSRHAATQRLRARLPVPSSQAGTRATGHTLRPRDGIGALLRIEHCDHVQVPSAGGSCEVRRAESAVSFALLRRKPARLCAEPRKMRPTYGAEQGSWLPCRPGAARTSTDSRPIPAVRGVPEWASAAARAPPANDALTTSPKDRRPRSRRRPMVRIPIPPISRRRFARINAGQRSQ